MAAAMVQSPYDTNDAGELQDLANAADVYLQAQLIAAVAADQRALVFAGFLAAATAAIGSRAISILSQAPPDQFLGRLSLDVAGGLLAAMLFAILAARPTRWFFPGSQPESWKEDFKAQKPKVKRLQELLADYDTRIRKNHAVMKWNGRLVMLSAILSVCVLGLAGVSLARHFNL